MTDFNWKKTLYSQFGEGVTCEELYQLFVARMKAEGLIENGIAGLVTIADLLKYDEPLYKFFLEKLEDPIESDAFRLSKAELRADGENNHAKTCKSPFGVCTCSGGDNF